MAASSNIPDLPPALVGAMDNLSAAGLRALLREAGRRLGDADGRTPGLRICNIGEGVVAFAVAGAGDTELIRCGESVELAPAVVLAPGDEAADMLVDRTRHALVVSLSASEGGRVRLELKSWARAASALGAPEMIVGTGAGAQRGWRELPAAGGDVDLAPGADVTVLAVGRGARLDAGRLARELFRSGSAPNAEPETSA